MLSVFRDGTLHGQAELTANGLRIGRGSENDIVLEDAAKRVSRLHAELRLDGDGSITLSDLQSANGTWIAGDRVDNEAIEPGVPFTIGPYRLMLEEVTETAVSAPALQSLPAESSDDSADGLSAEPLATLPPSLPMPSAAQAPVPQLPVDRAPIDRAPVDRAPVDRPAVDRPPVDQPPFDQPRASTVGKRKGDTTKMPGWTSPAGVVDLVLRYRWAAVVAAVAIISLAGLGIYAISKPDVPAEATTVVDPVTPPGPGTPTPPTADPDAAHLDEADRLLVQGDKPSAEIALRDHITPVLQKDPTHARALDLKSVAEKIITPVPSLTPPSTPPGPRPTPPTVDPRVQQQQRLAEARGALERNDYRSALTAIESLIADAPDYADAAALRQRILSERLEMAKRIAGEAEELAKNGRLPEAIETFRRAESVDGAVGVGPRVTELRARMAQEGEQAFIDGYNFSMAQRPDQAIPLLRKAYQYLPDGHKDKAAARAELERLRVGVK